MIQKLKYTLIYIEMSKQSLLSVWLKTNVGTIHATH